MSDLLYGDPTLPREFLLRLLARVRVGEVGVKVFIQNFLRCFTEVSSLSPKKYYLKIFQKYFNSADLLASRNLDLSTITDSQADCLSCIWMVLNFLLMIFTILSISFGVIGLRRLCSLSKVITWVVNSCKELRFLFETFKFLILLVIREVFF